MISTFLIRVLSTHVIRGDLDTSFIKILDDQTMRDAIRKVPSSFVLFHADHLQPSDAAYFKYAKAAAPYKDQSNFYVVPASVGADVARTYASPGNPSLMHFNRGTKDAVYAGLFTHKALSNFIANYTKAHIITPKNTTDVMTAIGEATNMAPTVIAAFADKTTKFGRAVYQLADELSAYFPFVLFEDPEAAAQFGVRFPSLTVVRYEDSQRAIYDDEPDSDLMFIWVQRQSLPAFRQLDYQHLFSMDGVSMRSVVSLFDLNSDEQTDHAFRTLGNISSKQSWIRCYYGDFHEYKALAKLVGADKPSLLFIAANYTHFSFAVKDLTDVNSFDEFYEEKMELTTIKTPPAMYNDLRPVTEFAFESMHEEGPFFALFSSAFCVKCKSLKTAAYDAASTIRHNGGKINWAFWDVTKATPSFQSNISLGVPSIWYFEDADVTLGEAYAGPTNFLSIVEWVHGKAPDTFDLDEIIAKETGSTFSDI